MIARQPEHVLAAVEEVHGFEPLRLRADPIRTFCRREAIRRCPLYATIKTRGFIAEGGRRNYRESSARACLPFRAFMIRGRLSSIQSASPLTLSAASRPRGPAASGCIFVLCDACGDVSVEAHDRAIDRMVQAGAQPMSALQYLLELQRDWSRTTTYDLTTGIAKRFGGAYGLGITYAKTMFDASEGH